MTAAGTLAILLLITLPGPADPDPACAPGRRVRAVDAGVQALLDDAARRSVTIRGLMDRLACTDAIVYVEIMASPSAAMARTKLVTASADARFLRVGIKATVQFPDITPILGHELQHAVEIAERPDVRDEDAMRRLFAKIGRQVGHDSYETDEAHEVERRVRVEMRRK